VLATDDSWKWYMGMVAREKDHSAYLRLWRGWSAGFTRTPAWTRSRSPYRKRGGPSGKRLSSG